MSVIQNIRWATILCKSVNDHQNLSSSVALYVCNAPYVTSENDYFWVLRLTLRKYP